MTSEHQIDTSTRRMAGYFGIVYASQAVCNFGGFLNQPLRYFLREGQGLGPAEMASFLFLVQLPWIAKPLYGLVSDFVPLWGYRRRPYLLALNGIAATALVWSVANHSIRALTVSLFLMALGIAASDVIVDASMIENGRDRNRVRLFQGVQWLSRNAIALVGAFAGAYLCYDRPPNRALELTLAIAAIAPLTVFAVTWISVSERREAQVASAAKHTWSALLDAFRSGPLWIVVAFWALHSFSPATQTPLYFHFRDQLQFTPSFLGAVDASYSSGRIAGTAIFLFGLRNRMSTRRSVALGIGAAALGTVPLLLMSGPTTALLATFIYGVGYMIGDLTALTLAAEACPVRVEGFAFAGIAAVSNLSVQYGDVLGSRLYQGPVDGNINVLIGLTILTTLLGLPFLRFLRSGHTIKADLQTT